MREQIRKQGGDARAFAVLATDGLVYQEARKKTIYDLAEFQEVILLSKLYQEWIILSVKKNLKIKHAFILFKNKT